MAPPPREVVQWLRRNYPRPTVDPVWLEACYEWIQENHNLDPARDMPAILKHVEAQLLGSDLADSMLDGTGIPEDILVATDAFLEGPILVQVADIMEIGHSAYNLLQVYESREEWRKQEELRARRGEDADEGEERKPMPKYPRSMLQFQLSDGKSILPAIECKKMPEFELGETPLGYKVGSFPPLSTLCSVSA
ncbi:DUF1767-domain-containing protein [Trametes cingulata]|nr:DUF1767-domain-containing protein [Trametes cingulata]